VHEIVHSIIACRGSSEIRSSQPLDGRTNQIFRTYAEQPIVIHHKNENPIRIGIRILRCLVALVGAMIQVHEGHAVCPHPGALVALAHPCSATPTPPPALGIPVLGWGPTALRGHLGGTHRQPGGGSAAPCQRRCYHPACPCAEPSSRPMPIREGDHCLAGQGSIWEAHGAPPRPGGVGSWCGGTQEPAGKARGVGACEGPPSNLRKLSD